MSLNSDIRDRAYQFFIEEARELLQTLETGLLSLSEDRSTNQVHELMRAAHSLKGGAASIDLEAIKILAHRLEDFFKALYSDKVEFNSELESLLLQAYDCLRYPLTKQIETGSFDSESALVTAEPIFEQLEDLLGDALKEADKYIPTSADLGIDVVSSIFEIDVAQAIEHLTEVIANPNHYNIVQEVKTQAELFAGFAELFNLPGFAEITQATLDAVKNHPEQALEIAKLMLADCQQARDLVLAGDRQRGGEPSAALLALSQSPELTSAFTEGTEVDDVFSLENIFGDDLDNESDAEIIPLDDIFGESLELNPADESIPVNNESDTEIIPLDDIFGESLELNPAAESTPVDNESNTETIPLDDVFGESLNNSVDLSAESKVLRLEKTEPASTSSVEAQEFKEPQQPEIPQPLNLDEAIESIETVFDRLPPLQGNLAPVSTSQPPEIPPKSAKNKVKSPQDRDEKITNLTVKIDLERLERMNNLIGELVINRNSLSLKNEQLQQKVEELVNKFTRFHKVTVRLREFSDRMLVESERSENNYFAVSNQHQTEFDSLEMDRYSRFYTLLQKVSEEIMQLEEGVEDISLFARQSNLSIKQQRQMLGQMRNELMWARMLPLDQIMQRFPRMLRDLSQKYQKLVALKMTGTGVLVDKAVLEKLYDPLMHLLRNAFDHGIEQPEVRRQQGKPEKGQITIRAYYQGDRTVIEVQDDGNGLNLKKIAQKAIEQDLLTLEQAQMATRKELLDLIFEPGFSTADKVSELSGRGVGMDVVRSQLRSLKGKIEVDSTPGKGTIFTLQLPLTLTIAKLLVCSIGSTAFAIPSDSIAEIIIPKSSQLQKSRRQRFLFWNNQLVPIYAVRELLRYNCVIYSAGLRSKIFDTVTPPADWALPLLLLRLGQKLFALEVDKLITEQESVIKPFGNAISPPKYTYGCTILGDGTILPVIDGIVLINEVLGINKTQTENNLETLPLSELSDDAESEAADNQSQTKSSQTVKIPTILVVDDSTALRKTMALSLEKQGYQVLQAVDGREALEQLKNHSDIDLIICDIEMPNMNGFEFLGVRRRDNLLIQIPVVMLTSRSGGKHRSLAKQLGADAYFTKPFIEQEFIGELKNILAQKNNKSEASSRFKPKTISGATILIIDDSSALRKTMTLSLEKKNYRVLQARHGQEALEQLQQNPQVNLIICDIEMPMMNGFEFLDAHRQDSKISQIPVAMLSSRSSEKHRNLSTQLGAVAFFTKPYVEENLLQEIQKIMETHN